MAPGRSGCLRLIGCYLFARGPAQEYYLCLSVVSLGYMRFPECARFTKPRPYRTPTSSRERRAPAGPNRSPTKYTYLFFFSNLLANLSVPKWRPSGRIPGVACLRLIENPSSILVSPPFSRAVARSSSQPTTTLHLASRAGHSAALLCQHSARCQSLKREEAAQREHR